jgi:hypothetical protein
MGGYFEEEERNGLFALAEHREEFKGSRYGIRGSLEIASLLVPSAPMPVEV